MEATYPLELRTVGMMPYVEKVGEQSLEGLLALLPCVRIRVGGVFHGAERVVNEPIRIIGCLEVIHDSLLYVGKALLRPRTHEEGTFLPI